MESHIHACITKSRSVKHTHCTQVYIYTHTHTHTHMHTHTHTHTQTQTHTHTCTHTHTHTQTHTYTLICTHNHTFTLTVTHLPRMKAGIMKFQCETHSCAHNSSITHTQMHAPNHPDPLMLHIHTSFPCRHPQLTYAHSSHLHMRTLTTMKTSIGATKAHITPLLMDSQQLDEKNMCYSNSASCDLQIQVSITISDAIVIVAGANGNSHHHCWNSFEGAWRKHSGPSPNLGTCKVNTHSTHLVPFPIM